MHYRAGVIRLVDRRRDCVTPVSIRAKPRGSGSWIKSCEKASQLKAKWLLGQVPTPPLVLRVRVQLETGMGSAEKGRGSHIACRTRWKSESRPGIRLMCRRQCGREWRQGGGPELMRHFGVVT